MTGDFFLTQWFFLGMRWLCENVVNNNVFLTILISTILLRLLTLFSDIKQRKTSAKTAALQPEIEKLKKRYQNDPQRLQQEQMKLMKESGVSMFGGCLPLILTMVFLFCFIAAFRFWGYEQNAKVVLEMSENISQAMRAEGIVDKDTSDVDCIKKLTELSALTASKDDATTSDVVTSSAATQTDANTSDKANVDPEAEKAVKEAEETLNRIYSKTEISKTFNNSKFLWINNIWQPDNGFSPVVIPDSTFFGVNYKSTKKLIYFKDDEKDGKVVVNENKQKLIDLGIFFDETEGYDKLSEEEQAKLAQTAVDTYNVLMKPIADKHSEHNNGWFILPVLATVFQLVYAIYMQKQQSAANAQANQQGAGSMKFMTYLMPVLTFIFCLSYTASFAMYWTLSSMTMLVVNIILSKVIKTNTNTKKEA